MLNKYKTYLSDLVFRDQNIRHQFQFFMEEYKNQDEGLREWIKNNNTSRDDVFNERAYLLEFIKYTKLFHYSEFDECDWNNFWLLSQHCDFDRLFQQQAIKIIQQYQGIEHQHYKYLHDRISCGLYGIQKYNTQDICELDQR